MELEKHLQSLEDADKALLDIFLKAYTNRKKRKKRKCSARAQTSIANRGHFRELEFLAYHHLEWCPGCQDMQKAIGHVTRELK